MSYPNVIYGKFGDEKVAQATKIGGLPVGVLMVLPDGREFHQVRASSTAEVVAGNLTTAAAVVADHGCGTADNLVVAAATIGASSIIVTMGGTTATTKDQYADGYLGVRDDKGEGQIYRIKSHNAAAAASTCTVALELGDEVAVAIAATATVSLVANPYAAILTRPAGTACVGPITGVPQVALPANSYGWALTKGLGMGLTAATAIVIGEPVVSHTAVAGAVGPVTTAAGSAATTISGLEADILGRVRVVGIDTEYSVIDWKIK